MGCGMSSNEAPPNPLDINQQQLNPTNPGRGERSESIEIIFRKIDEEIGQMESECPGPRLSILQSWIEHLEQLKDVKIVEITENELFMDRNVHQRRRSSIISTISHSDNQHNISQAEINVILNQERNDTLKVRQIVNKLGVVTDPVKAKQNEELLAIMSRSSISFMNVDVLVSMIEHSKKRSVELLEKFTKLKELYADLDGILTAVTGGTYVSPTEQALDKELESARLIRDKLGAVSEQWRISSTLILAASKSAAQAVDNWSSLTAIKLPSEKLSLCLDCRQHLVSSATALAEAQNALPQVDIPNIMARQLSEIQHINQYLLTDMANEGRTKQIKVILDVYLRNTKSALDWLQSTYKKTMLKNFQDAESNVEVVAKKLRVERLKFIGVTMGRKVIMSPNRLK